MLSTVQPRFVQPRPTITTDNTSFIDWIRMAAILSIVAVHCIITPPVPASMPLSELSSYPLFQKFQPGQVGPILIMGQCMRFGSIMFFIVSGYLLGHKLTEQSPVLYYQRRLRVILVPFLIAFGLFVLKSLVYNALIADFISIAAFAQMAWRKTVLFLTETPFWFIPNYFLSLAMLLLFRQHLNKRWFGAMLVGINLFYAINAHALWLHPRHNHALFGFVFYLWLGYMIAQKRLVARSRYVINTPLLVLLTGVLFVLAIYEARWLFDKNMADPLNSLRLTNQLFTISLFFLLTRVNPLAKLTWLRPRQEAYGTYLYHTFFISILIRLTEYVPVLRWLDYQPQYSGATLVVVWLLRFVLIYAATLLLVKIIAASRFRWIIGAKPIS